MSDDDNQHLSEVVFSTLVGFSFKWPRVWGTGGSRREPYQESKEPGEPQESDFSPKKKSESSVRNVLEHCRDGGA